MNAVLLFVALFLFLPSALRSQDPARVQPYSQAQCPSCAAWNEPNRPVHLFANTFYVGTRGLASILIASPDGHVLIDGGLSNSAPLILDNIRALGFKPSDVKIILNSHAHYDHAGGIAALQQVTGARVVASEPSAAVMRSGTPGRANDKMRSITNADRSSSVPVSTVHHALDTILEQRGVEIDEKADTYPA